MSHTFDPSQLPSGSAVHSLRTTKAVGTIDWFLHFAVAPDGQTVEVWTDGFLHGATDLPYSASRSDWSRIPLRSPVPVEWVRDFWRDCLESGTFTLVNPCEREG